MYVTSAQHSDPRVNEFMFVDNVGGFGVDVNDIVAGNDIVDVNDIVDGPPVQVPTIIYHQRHTGQMQPAVNLDKASASKIVQTSSEPSGTL